MQRRTFRRPNVIAVEGNVLPAERRDVAVELVEGRDAIGPGDHAPRRRRDGAYPCAFVPIMPAERAVCGIGLPIKVERCRGVLRGAQRQSVD
jgi:hypothetical protein